MNNETSTPADKTPFDNFTGLARRLFAVPKHELDEEIEGKGRKQGRKADAKN